MRVSHPLNVHSRLGIIHQLSIVELRGNKPILNHSTLQDDACSYVAVGPLDYVLLLPPFCVASLHSSGVQLRTISSDYGRRSGLVVQFTPGVAPLQKGYLNKPLTNHQVQTKISSGGIPNSPGTPKRNSLEPSLKVAPNYPISLTSGLDPRACYLWLAQQPSSASYGPAPW